MSQVATDMEKGTDVLSMSADSENCGKNLMV